MVTQVLRAEWVPLVPLVRWESRDPWDLPVKRVQEV